MAQVAIMGRAERRQNLEEIRGALRFLEEYGMQGNAGKERRIQELEGENQRLQKALAEKDRRIEELEQETHQYALQKDQTMNELRTLEGQFQAKLSSVDREKKDLEDKIARQDQAIRKQRTQMIYEDFEDVDLDSPTGQLHNLQRKLIVAQDELGSKEISLKMLQHYLLTTQRSIETAQGPEKQRQIDAMFASMLEEIAMHVGPTQITTRPM
eukprot:TRINITY_DN490_c0_g1_i1.p1 TRINITY_DN490_c0_g1~~TRINITY_DN490_c0_g1_i1.p1  ORF type:complete len:223 (+),score=58.48 TRINITY_DN490_c0_g1_i1:34-669(+)